MLQTLHKDVDKVVMTVRTLDVYSNVYLFILEQSTNELISNGSEMYPRCYTTVVQIYRDSCIAMNTFTKTTPA